MKRKIFILSMLIGTGVVLITSCSKDDEDAPVVSVTGPTSIEVSLNSPDWEDLGATAHDEEDGDITTVTSDAGPTNPNTDMVGTYTITYSATDAAGNVGTAIRTIRVKNDAEDFAGMYNVYDTVPGLAFTYPQEISVDNTQNNRVHFNRFADYANNTTIYANKTTGGELEIPVQTTGDIGSGSGACDVLPHEFKSTDFTSTTHGFILKYTDEKISADTCGSFTAGTATYTRQ
jgi:hypothetical protein